MSNKRKSIPKEIRQKIYDSYNGNCGYCGCKLEYKDMQVDHIEAHYLGGENEEDNYMPSCRMCNFYKSTLSIDGFREQLGLIVDRLIKTSFIFRLALKYELITINEKEIKFYFEGENE